MQVGVYEVASVDGAAYGGGGEVDVDVCVGERRRKYEFLGGERFEEAVRDDDEGIALAALAGFDEATAVV